jgi:hypothetical protein
MTNQRRAVVAKSKHSKREPSAEVEGVKIRGVFRVAIEEDGEIVWDSGDLENQITYDGWRVFLAGSLINYSGSTMRAGYIAIGTGSTQNASASTMTGEIGGGTIRQAITTGANSGSVVTATSGASASMCVTFPSGSTGMTGNIGNVGIYSGSSGSGFFAGGTFATQALSSNQAVQVSYAVGFN